MLLFLYFEVFICWWVGIGSAIGSVEQKILCRTGGNGIISVSGFIQGWGMLRESRISSF